MLEFLAGLTMVAIILYLLVPLAFFALVFGITLWIFIYE